MFLRSANENDKCNCIQLVVYCQSNCNQTPTSYYIVSGFRPHDFPLTFKSMECVYFKKKISFDIISFHVPAMLPSWGVGENVEQAMTDDDEGCGERDFIYVHCNCV